MIEPGLQRAFGELRIGFKTGGDRTVLATLRQEGCLKARLPRRLDPGWAEFVQLNNSGGVASGDRLSTQLSLAPGARAVVSTASAERVYRRAAGSGAATVRNRIELEPGSRAEWLPQETILFDGCALDRALTIEMAASAHLLGVETIIFGRIAMGEQVRRAVLRDLIRIRRDGRLILHDVLRPPETIADSLSRTAGGGGARAMVTLFQVCPEAGRAIDAVRTILAAHSQVEAGASAWDGMMLVRMVARDPAAARVVVIALLHLLRNGRMVPTVWRC